MRQSLDDQWEPPRQVVARTAVQLHPLAILAGDDPEAIVFYLVQPLITRSNRPIVEVMHRTDDADLLLGDDLVDEGRGGFQLFDVENSR